MCLPCFTEVFVEEELPKKKEEVLYTVWDAKARTYVKVPKSMIPPQPVVYQQPYITQPQPIYAAPSPAISPPYYNIQPQPYPSTGYPTFDINQPAHGTYGYTGTEMLMQNMGQAAHPDFTKKQEMKPSDPDPYRMYWCREPDNTWTQRNRMTIESGDIGDCRWYATDGQFYAVRLG
ncbi:hypothetical protein ONS95_010066 [Cadophora gregata]|uniref:uncharacterized protein n=1 Tax=Cadophora gregata TaxID=51156 RepID=UPI0026DD1705|nr:uncharacterized protein ONS95_010066 [Cadophora gregata]KAK0121783.1 hypothetical protein ONS95_010066 [Cadophora gregata]KAK0127258.1 hypothetical protein ONS96_006809 [Cadophora gregata f. sp. sojae]